MLFLAIAFLPHRVCGNSDKDDAVAVFMPPGFRYTTFGDFTNGRSHKSRQAVMLLTQTLGPHGVDDPPPIDARRLAELEATAEQHGDDLGVYTTPAGHELLETRRRCEDCSSEGTP